METVFRANSRSKKDTYHHDSNEITLFRFEGSLKDLSIPFRDASGMLAPLQKFPAPCHSFVETHFPIFSNFRRGFSLRRNRASSPSACSEMEIAFQSNSPRRLGRGARSQRINSIKIAPTRRARHRVVLEIHR